MSAFWQFERADVMLARLDLLEERRPDFVMAVVGVVVYRGLVGRETVVGASGRWTWDMEGFGVELSLAGEDIGLMTFGLYADEEKMELISVFP